MLLDNDKLPESPTSASSHPCEESDTKVMSAPRWRVLLHNDDVNSMQHVVKALMQVFHFTADHAFPIMLEAHNSGVALCQGGLSQEYAEFKKEQLEAFSLTATIEPEEN